MQELLKKRIASLKNNEEKAHRTREFLQVLILKIFFDNGAFQNLAFVGGTALRVCFGLRRFSEDLDFNLIQRRGYNFASLLNRIQKELKRYNLTAETRTRESGVVQSSFLKFPRLLQELGISEHPRQKLSIKIEIDTNPPEGWRLSVYPVSETFVFAVNGYDLPSLYATKLHACFFRPYIKGRDFYDLVWYLGRRIEPNYALLNNAIRQTEKRDLKIGPKNFRSFLRSKLEKLNFNSIRRDVERFLEDKSELNFLDSHNILKMIETI